VGRPETPDLGEHGQRRRGGAPCTPRRRPCDVETRIPGRTGSLRALTAPIRAATGHPSRPEGEKRGSENRKGPTRGRNTPLTLSRRPHFIALGDQLGGGVALRGYYARVHVIRVAEEARRPRRPARSPSMTRHIGHASLLPAGPTRSLLLALLSTTGSAGRSGELPPRPRSRRRRLLEPQPCGAPRPAGSRTPPLPPPSPPAWSPTPRDAAPGRGARPPALLCSRRPPPV